MNIAKILKDCPKETKLYSPMYGNLWFASVQDEIITCYKFPLEERCTRAILEQENTISFFDNGTTGLPDFNVSKECMLFPSKENRDWSTFKAPKKEHEFKPFEKVLVRVVNNEGWRCSMFSNYCEGDFEYLTISGFWKQCIPYEGNEHLLGTTNNPT